MEKKEKFEQVQNIIVREVNLVKTNAENNSCGCIIGPFFVVKDLNHGEKKIVSVAALTCQEPAKMAPTCS